MELHSHKENIEHVAVSHPILGFIFMCVAMVGGIFSVTTEQTLSDANLALGILVKLVTVASFILSVVIYWDKITTNGKQIKQDIKEKLQKKK